MKLWEHYHVAHSVHEALDLLGHYGGSAQIIAGGTDLLLDLQQGSHPPAAALVDVTRIPELTAVESLGNTLILGAGITHNAIVLQPILRARATCLVESCGVVGGPQVRNVATLGGNVAHALPAADGTLSLVALNAEAEIADASGRAWLPIADLFLGPGKSRVDPTRQLITRFRFALSSAGQASAFKRIMRPQGVALPILGCAAWVSLAAGRFEDVRIVLGPVGPTPTRAIEAETLLRGQPAEDEQSRTLAITLVSHQAQTELHPRTSKYRATSEYRTEMIGLLVREALALATHRARTGEVVPEGVG